VLKCSSCGANACNLLFGKWQVWVKKSQHNMSATVAAFAESGHRGPSERLRSSETGRLVVLLARSQEDMKAISGPCRACTLL
jgi:hypothetical protein